MKVDSLNWLVFNWLQGRNSLLADEMGLGKTLQSASFVQHLQSNFKDHFTGPTLVIAPLSTLEHWRREFTEWTGLNAIIYHGSKDSRDRIRKYEFFHQADLKQAESKADAIFFGPTAASVSLIDPAQAKQLVGKKIRKFISRIGHVMGTIKAVVDPSKKKNKKKGKKQGKGKGSKNSSSSTAASDAEALPVTTTLAERLLEGLETLRAEEYAGEFNEPVEMEGYTDIVDEPMDLGTIHIKLSCTAEEGESSHTIPKILYHRNVLPNDFLVHDF